MRLAVAYATIPPGAPPPPPPAAAVPRWAAGRAGSVKGPPLRRQGCCASPAATALRVGLDAGASTALRTGKSGQARACPRYPARPAAAAHTHPAGTGSPGGQVNRAKTSHGKRTLSNQPSGDLQKLDRAVSYEEPGAAVEVLRLTGVRVEELLEISHHSLVQYRLSGPVSWFLCCRSSRQRLIPNDSWSSAQSWPTSCRSSSAASAGTAKRCLSSGIRPARMPADRPGSRCCSSAGSAPTAAGSATARSGTCSPHPSQQRSDRPHRQEPAALEPTTSGGSSSPTPS